MTPLFIQKITIKILSSRSDTEAHLVNSLWAYWYESVNVVGQFRPARLTDQSDMKFTRNDIIGLACLLGLLVVIGLLVYSHLATGTIYNLR